MLTSSTQTETHTNTLAMFLVNLHKTVASLTFILNLSPTYASSIQVQVFISS